MKYLCLICADTWMEKMPEVDAQKHFEEYREFTDDLRRSAPRRTQPAATSRHRDHGPGAQRPGLDHRWAYAETKEQFGGYYVIETRI